MFVAVAGSFGSGLAARGKLCVMRLAPRMHAEPHACLLLRLYVGCCMAALM
jgi:hypothetical protein